MLYFRIGQASLPISLKCSYCPHISEANELFYVAEVMVDRELTSEETKKRFNPELQYETMCPACYRALLDAALRFDTIKVDMDFRVEGLTLAPEDLQPINN